MPIYDNNPCDECTPVVEVVLPAPCDTECDEIINSKCVVYTNDDLSCLYDTGEATSLRLDVILKRMAEFMCNLTIDTPVLFDVSCLLSTQVIQLGNNDAINFLIDHLCALDINVTSADCSIAVVETELAYTNKFTHDLSIAFGATTYEEDLGLLNPLEVDVVKDFTPGSGINCGQYHLRVKTNPITATLTQTLSDFNLNGTAYTSLTDASAAVDTQLFQVTYEGTSGGGGSVAVTNKVVKTGVNVSLNSYFRVEILDSILNPYLPTVTYDIKGVSSIAATNSYIALGSIQTISFLPNSTQMFSCKFIVLEVDGGPTTITGVVDPNCVVTGIETATYVRKHFDGMIRIVNVGGSYAEVRFSSLEPFDIPLNLNNRVEIFSSSALAYNIV